MNAMSRTGKGSPFRLTAVTLGGAATLLLSACNFAPHYKQPVTGVQSSWPSDTYTPTVQSKLKVSDLGWEEFFTDPRLKKLISLALNTNRDLASQFAAIVQARGQYEMQNSALFPNISTGAGAMYQDPSTNAGFSFAPGSDSGHNGQQMIKLLHFYQTSIGFSSYEIDLWGRIRNLSKAQKEETLSSYDNLRNLWISTISQLASTYIQWLADVEMLKVAQARQKNQEETYRLTKLSFVNGEENALTMAQIASQIDQARTDVSVQIGAIGRDVHALQLLVGQPLPADLPPPAPFGHQTVLADLPAGLPSDMLQQRPDIREAEHKLRAANANIGAARAAFYPRFTLTASEGISSLQFKKLFTNMSETWGLSPSVSIPLLTWGQNSGNLHTAKAAQAQAVAQYQKTVQKAFKEVSDALTSRETYKLQDESMARVVGNTKQAYDLAYLRFREGIDNYLATLEEERQLFMARQFHIYVQGARYQNMVTLYRALGGGWRRYTPGTPVTAAATFVAGTPTGVAQAQQQLQERAQLQAQALQADENAPPAAHPGQLPSVSHTMAADSRGRAQGVQVQGAAERAATIRGPVPDSPD
ncbi:efflux transporter outer membrane subunit [Oecophyllibacter saccharovorans]|uniref:efflux transporter outer membrane subunit n=1 Tax=Oecophyllibacter saccharovorans TaxID=2558360 RepID=UPI001F4FE15E|nr:efflux transporter outer membrane subunit [Oecophyllibacter saccharovorans]